MSIITELQAQVRARLDRSYTWTFACGHVFVSTRHDSPDRCTICGNGHVVSAVAL